ncbi:MAG: acyltransferase domain-containing protein, partial [Frankia sp.]|nr:acyltransferase domain-containing protein [Frankia sp.]
MSSSRAGGRPSGSEPAGAGAAVETVLAVTPFGQPHPHLVAAAHRAGALGVLDLGRDRPAAMAALADAARWCAGPGGFGVRVGPYCPVRPDELPERVTAVLLAGPVTADGRLRPGAGADATADAWAVAAASGDGRRRVLVEVTSLDEAVAAAAAGASGLVARGNESGGRVGEMTAFTLLQQLLAERDRGGLAGLPVWVAGGIGPHTAAAALAGGAAGVLLDSQLALVPEVELAREVERAVRSMDGTETAVLAGHRVYVRPDLPAAGLVGDPELTPAAVAGRLGGGDLRAALLPVGQDGALAVRLAREHRSAAGIIRAVRESALRAVAAAARLRPLTPGGTGALFAADRPDQADQPERPGRAVRLPVAQGPMTRVSDRPEFARAVADAGGLPFLALALLPAEDVGALLARTAELLGDAPWGVGLLGFAPPELRAAQLAAVAEARPPFALIAGGRPAQAAALGAAGIETFLHVPSPGLLTRFLAEGVRGFVFEGRECGGHVGPRTSFALWEAQVAALLAAEVDLAEVRVLFAGGVHDARSAAMVAATAAPLVERGARIGLLMGSAYLFTEEAVAAGAIGEQFQRQALECASTVLLQTAPGHAVRCADSPFVATFHEVRSQLTAQGVTGREAWARLEALNLGRLRLASRGLRRDGDRLVPVDAAEQRREGMFMLGQVAALRSSTTTVAALHEEVTAGADRFLAARAAELAETTGLPAPAAAEREEAGAEGAAGQPVDVAIVGMACLFPGAGDVGEFWANVCAGRDLVTEVPADRWDAGRFYSPAAADPRRQAAGSGGPVLVPSKWGGFLSPVPFDPLRYGIPPRSLPSIDTAQLLALEVSARALVDAGYDPGTGGADRTGTRLRAFDRERTSVIFGAESGADITTAYSFRSAFASLFGDVPAALDAALPVVTEDSFPGMLANVIAGRVANRLDLGGLNQTVDAACGSSLAAVDAACKELAAGSSDMVVCGGVDTHNSLHDYLLFSSVHALSPTGRSRSFDAAADGIALGEGVAVLVLRRLADAERDGDRILAVIRSVAASSDGRALGMTAPRREGQVRALRRAYRRAGVSPAQVGVVEAHATGTVVGDRTELAALTEVFTAAGSAPGSVSVGSVKSQIGHAKCAAGLAGLIKAVQAVRTGARPPTVNLTRPNPYWDPATSPLYFDTEARPWAAPPAERIAGVSAFGFGGTNFHAVIRAYDGGPEPAHGLEHWPAELFVIRAADRAGALRELDRLADLVARNDAAGRPWRLRDLAAAVSLAGEATGAPVAAAFVVDTLDALPDAIARARAARTDRAAGVFVADGLADGGPLADGGRLADGGPASDGAAGQPEVAFLFPGQGSQRPAMLADLFVAFPRLRRLLGHGAIDPAVLFPPAPLSPDERARQQEAITDTRRAQPALGVAGLAMADLLTGLGIRPGHAAGHSYGELVALAIAGAFDERTLLELSVRRGEAVASAAEGASGSAGPAGPGAMAAVAASAAPVRAALGALLGGQLVIANDNAPRQVVLSGPTAAVEDAVGRLAAAGLTARRLPVACAFHSPVVAAAADELAAALAGAEVRPPRLRVWSNTTAAPYLDEPAGGTADMVRELLARQVAEPVRFVEQIEAMYAAGVRVFVEAGPGRVLTGLVGKILAGRPHRAVACDVPGENGLRRFLLAVAELAAAGVAMDVSPLFAGRGIQPVDPADTPPAPSWFIDGAFVRGADGRPLPGGLRSADQPLLAPAAGRGQQAADAPALAGVGVGARPGYGAGGARPPEGSGTDSGNLGTGTEITMGATGGTAASIGYDTTSGTANGTGAAPGPAAFVPAASNGHHPVGPLTGMPAPAPTAAPAATPVPAATALPAPAAVPAAAAVPGAAAVPAAAASPAAAAVPGAAAVPATGQPAAPRTALDDVVLGYLGFARELLASQHQTVLRYLDLVGPAVASQYPSGALAPLAAAPALPVSQVSVPAATAPAGVAPPAPPPGQPAGPAVAVPPAGLLAAPAPAPQPSAPSAPAPPPAPAPPAGPASVPAPASVPVAPSAAVPAPLARSAPPAAPPAPASAAEPAGQPAVPAPDEVMAAVLAVVGERTGYPARMLDPDLDLEADLSIDSIKRVEILAAVADRLGLSTGAAGGGVDESLVEELAELRTVRGIVDRLVQKLGGGAPADRASATPAAAPAAVAPTIPASPPASSTTAQPTGEALTAP